MHEEELNGPEVPFDPFQEQKMAGEGEYPWRKPIEVDKALLTPEATSTKLMMTLPKITKKKVAVALKNKEGGLLLTADGKVLFQETIQEVFEGFEAKEIDLPGQEIFNIDLNSSFLNERDIAAIRSLQALYADLQLQTLKGKDRTEDTYYVYTRLMSVIETAKARDGRTAELVKTSITKGTSEQAIIQKYKEEEKKKFWQPIKH